MPRKNGITEKQFRNATTEQVLVDSQGRHWRIWENNSQGRRWPALLVQCPGWNREEIEYHPELGIIDEEAGSFAELNHPDAHIAPAPPPAPVS